MATLKTTYLGLPLSSPIIAGASPLTSNEESIAQLAEAGAGAIVIRSLFEEGIELERANLEEDLQRFDYLHPEMIQVFPELKHAGAEEHLMWVRRTVERVDVPVIASLNAVHRDTWVEYATQLASTGADALELNFYSAPASFDRSGVSMEDEQVATLTAIKEAVSLPISVKLSPFYTNPLEVIERMDEVGVDGFVLFNRFFQPDIDVSEEVNAYPLRLSQPGDYGLALRFTGLLSGQVAGSLCASSGIFTGEDIAKLVLAGADCVQTVSALLQNSPAHIGAMAKQLKTWMDEKGYKTLADFQGSLSKEKSSDRWAYTRAQYVRLLMRPDPLS
jgi:dihydroorotate dehydrogenase (fumarate)